MNYTNIVTEKKENIGIITLNRPQAMNSVNLSMLQELASVLSEFDTDDNIKVVVLRGDGKNFASGIDIREVLSKSDQTFFGIDEMQKEFGIFEKFSKPIIAAVAGYALGIGCELALACDIILAADNARFGQPELSLGCIPSFGATQRLTKALGKAKTMEMILSGRAMTADEAFDAGLVSRIVPLSDLKNHALETASKIATQPLNALRKAKEIILAAQNLPLDEGIVLEKNVAKCCLATDEFRETLRKFAQG